jgi:hypothetical protein
MGKAEHYVEGYLYKRVKSHRGLCMKFMSGITGVPDRIVVLAGHTVFVETKAPGEKARRLQEVRHQEIRAAGGDVRVIDTREQVDVFVAEILSSPITDPETEQKP